MAVSGLLGRGLFFASCALQALPALAWAPETRVRMAEEAVRLMPASLRLALEHHREPLLRGMLAPMVAEDGAEHRPPWAGGTLDAAIEREAVELLAALREPGPFHEVVGRFGRVAHYVADAGFPPGASQTDGAARYGHFSAFCEERRPRFPLVFYGHADEALAGGEWRRFALQELARAGQDDAELARAYAAAGHPPDPAAFDDRSVPFAVGSLAYSRSITNIVRVWLSVWQRASGDMGRTPYWQPAAPPGG
jgi:hypothetical protein